MRPKGYTMGWGSEDTGEPLFVISAAAKMISVHPQTLRLYERMGLIVPQRTKGRKRMYSMQDIQLVRFIQNLTRERGVNLAGVRVILSLQQQIDQLRDEMGKILSGLEKKLEGVPGRSRVSSNGAKGRGIRIKIMRG